MFALEAAVFVRQSLPAAFLFFPPEEILTRLFFGKSAGVSSNGRIDKDVVVYALNDEACCIRLARFGGGTYQYCVCWDVDGIRQPVPGSAICICLVTVSVDTT